jgi:hypothetical protein
MRLLLYTHTFLWFVLQEFRLAHMGLRPNNYLRVLVKIRCASRNSGGG